MAEAVTAEHFDDSTRGVACPWCLRQVDLAVAGDPTSPYTAPSGHVTHHEPDGSVVFDHCPQRPVEGGDLPWLSL